MNINLPVPVIRQERNSLDCGLAGLSMIYSYYGVPKTVNHLRKFMKSDKKGTYSPQLGSQLIKDGFKVELITHHPSLFTKNDRKLSQKKILAHIKRLKARARRRQSLKSLGYFIKFMESGGKLTVKIPTVKDVIAKLKKRQPVCALVTTNFISGTKPIFNYHFIVVRGIKGNKLIINDPLWDKRGGKKMYSFDEFAYALYASAAGDIDNASLFIAYK